MSSLQDETITDCKKDQKEKSTSAPPRDVPIRGETIRLGQLLKLAGIAQSGSEAKALLAAEAVAVNGEREARRGRQLHPGDAIRVDAEDLRVIRAGDAGP
ncbi:MAG TPA: RNA-binding S4 domain-containing protein [Solirubrobacteraceae bacterium]|jgi:ribosome-associated protein|nr:RNA-binding S4 domain-containing protein [Solirubrobacteraceae bacterium]